MTAVKVISPKVNYNPLNEFEDLLESSGYEYQRPSKTRLHFTCDGKQGKYEIMLELNEESKVIKASLVIVSTKSIPRESLEKYIAQANEATWHGFFMLDGVGNTLYKSLVQYKGLGTSDIIETLELGIDNIIKEADRFSVSLALSNDNDMPTLFQNDDDWTLENLTLMFSEIKGNA